MATSLPQKEWHNPQGPNFRAKDNLLIAATYDPRVMNVASQPLANFYWLNRIRVPAGEIITNVGIYVVIAGAGLTSGYLGVYEEDETRSGVSANTPAAFHTAGYRALPMTTPIPARHYERNIWAAMAFVGTTMPSLGQSDPFGAYGLVTANAGMPIGAPGRFNSGYMAGAVPLPNPINLDAMIDFFNFWMAVS